MQTTHSGNANVQLLIENGYQFQMNNYLKRGYEILKKNPLYLIGYTVLTIVIVASVQTGIPKVGQALGDLLGVMFIAGFYIVVEKIDKNQPYEFKDFFKSFELILPLLLVHIVGTLLTILGLILLIIPGIYLAVAYSFSMLFVIFLKMDFWDALESSRKLITKEWFSFFGFVLVIILINIAGVLALGIGLLFTLPLSLAAFYAAYDDILSQAQPEIHYVVE